MKKLMMTLAAVLCCGMIVSCNKSNTAQQDQKQDEKEAKDTTPAFIKATFTFYGTEDMVAIADMTGVFNDGTGEKTEPIQTAEWSKTLQAALPATLTFGRTVKLKEGVELSAEKSYTYSRKHGITWVLLNAKGEVITNSGGFDNGGTLSPQTMNGSQIAVILESHRMDATHTYKFDKDGKYLIEE